MNAVERRFKTLNIHAILLAAGLYFLAACQTAPTVEESISAADRVRPQIEMPRPAVVLMTDFGRTTEAVALCHGAILSIDSSLRIVDYNHDIEPYNIRQGSEAWRRTGGFPKGSVFVGVIDPGVGTTRDSIAVRTEAGMYYIAPNNGLVTAALEAQKLAEAVRLDKRRINPDWEPGTFDGRDLYAPAGALLARAHGDLSVLGDPVAPDEIVRLEPVEATVDGQAQSVSGVYLRTDEPFGNIWTNISAEDIKLAGIQHGDSLVVKIGGTERVIPLMNTFGDVPPGRAVAYLNSEGRLAIAVNQGSARELMGASPGQPVDVRRMKVAVGGLP